jgi:hypothetical protein
VVGVGQSGVERRSLTVPSSPDHLSAFLSLPQSSAWNVVGEHKVLAFPGVWSTGIRDSHLLVFWVVVVEVALDLDSLGS